MRTILFILQKEFLQVFRNRTMLPMILLMPVVQLLVLVNAATFELKSIDMAVLDSDRSLMSHELVSRFEGSPYFKLTHLLSQGAAEAALYDNSADVVLVIPGGFERTMVREGGAPVQLLINAIDGMAAGLIDLYAGNIIAEYGSDMALGGSGDSPAGFGGLSQPDETIGQGKPDRPGGLKPALSPIEVTHRFLFNPTLKYTIYMLPGILVILVTIVGMFLTAINIVREKEQGTIEQINATPILKYQFITGKLIPFLIIALFEFALGLLAAYLLFDMPVLGSLWLVFLITFAFLLVALGLGLLLSAISSNQQQVSFTIFFFLLLFILMSGIFTPTESMPEWAQRINIINPFKYYMRALRMILLKGAGIVDVTRDLLFLGIYGSIALGVAVWRYRKVRA